MLMLISQSGLTAIDATQIQFYVIDTNADGGGTFKLLAKTPTVENNFYEYLILFEHEDIEVVKATLEFLLVFQLACHDDFVLNVDLPNLYNLGMKYSPKYKKLISREDKHEEKIPVTAEN